MSRGGARPGAGRKKKTVTTEEWSGPTLPSGKNLRPLDFWLAIMRDDGAPFELRMSAAKECMPFMHAKPAPKRADQGDLGDTPAAGDDWTADLSPQVSEGRLQ